MKQIETQTALKVSVHSFFSRSARGHEIKKPKIVERIGIKRVISPATASFFWESPIVTLEPTSILKFSGFITSIFAVFEDEFKVILCS